MRRLVFALVLIAALTASCGGDSGTVTGEGSASGTGTGSASGTGTGSASGSAAAPPVSLDGKVNNHGSGEVEGDAIEIEADDYYFSPTFITAAPGSTVTVKLHNEGDEAHTFTIAELEVDTDIAIGGEPEFEVTIPESGTLVFLCTFHSADGMQGAFVVT